MLISFSSFAIQSGQRRRDRIGDEILKANPGCRGCAFGGAVKELGQADGCSY
jgi:hypothetical protein